jgi:hypothetical protein
VTAAERRAYLVAAARQGFSFSDFARWWLREGTLVGRKGRP